MVLFDKQGIKVFACQLPDDTPRRGPGRALAERAAIKRLLREAFPGDRAITIGHHPSGAPYLTREDDRPSPSPLPSISVSHCSRLAAIAIAPAGTRIGIDCESGDRMDTLQRTAHRFLSPEQAEAWGEYPATLWAWCVKEAAYKAAGQPGLALAWIPLPLEIPLGSPTPDSVIEISGNSYNVVQADTLDLPAILMLVFSDPASDPSAHDS